MTLPSAGPARFSATTAIACIALALSGCAVGILLGRWTATSSPAGERAVEAAAASADLRPAMTELQRTSEVILQTIRARGGTPQSAPSARESATSSPDDLGRLATAVERLNALLEANGGRLGGRSPSIEKWKGPGFPSLDALWLRVHQIARADDPDWGEKFDTEMNQAHIAWTRDDLFEHYGAPASLNSRNRGLELGYQRRDESDSTESIVFLIADDLVVYIYYEH